VVVRDVNSANVGTLTIPSPTALTEK
jgi:hypothetical protein